MLTDTQIVKAFKDLAIYEGMLGNKFKASTYTYVADMLEFVPDIPSSLKSGDIAKIKGIGPSSVNKIKELVNTGTMSKLQDYKRRVPETVLELTEIPNVGPKTAYKLYSVYGVESLEELKEVKVQNLNLNSKAISSIKNYI